MEQAPSNPSERKQPAQESTSKKSMKSDHSQKKESPEVVPSSTHDADGAEINLPKKDELPCGEDHPQTSALEENKVEISEKPSKRSSLKSQQAAKTSQNHKDSVRNEVNSAIMKGIEASGKQLKVGNNKIESNVREHSLNNVKEDPPAPEQKQTNTESKKSKVAPSGVKSKTEVKEEKKTSLASAAKRSTKKSTKDQAKEESKKKERQWNPSSKSRKKVEVNEDKPSNTRSQASSKKKEEEADADAERSKKRVRKTEESEKSISKEKRGSNSKDSRKEERPMSSKKTTEAMKRDSLKDSQKSKSKSALKSKAGSKSGMKSGVKKVKIDVAK